MNKKIFLLIPFVIALSGCDNLFPGLYDSSSKLESSEQGGAASQSSDSSGEGSSSVISSSASSEEHSSEVSSPEESSTLSSSEPQEELLTKSFTFRDGGYWNTNVQFDNGDNEANFLAKLNENAGEGDFFTDIDSLKVTSNIYGEETNSYTLIIGTSSSYGYLSLTCKYDIMQIDIVAQTYNKYDTFNGIWRIDSDAVLYVDDTEYDMSVTDTTSAPADVEISHIFDEPTKDFTFSNDEEGQRVFIHQITISYIA